MMLLRSSIPFPWVGLAELIESLPGRVLPIVGYGSLISEPSAGRTLRQAGSARMPCVVSGCRRVFNYNMPDAALERYGGTLNSAFRAALNVEVTGCASDVINGVLTELYACDVEAFRRREHGYDLVPVSCTEWMESGGSECFPAFILAAPDLALRAEWQVVRGDIMPQPDYLRLCEAGAGAISKSYLDFFRETTFLADKLTRISSWTQPAA